MLERMTVASSVVAFLLGACSVATWFFILFRLRRQHPDFWQSLGAPSAFGWTSIFLSPAGGKLLLGSEHLALADARLNALVSAQRLLTCSGLLAVLICFLLMMYALATDSPPASRH
jgi:hypothetical protein